MSTPRKIIFQPENEGDAHLIAALDTQGDYATWVELIKRLQPFPRVMFCIYASCAAPMLLPCEAPNFIVDLAGDTSRGKTTALEVAASVWGLPAGHQGGLVKSWNQTKVFAERYAALFNDLPVFFDDSQTSDARNVASVLYMVANGIGRGRGTAKGGVQRTLHWRTICFSTGEQPLTSNTEFGGARARVLTLWGSPFGDQPQGELVREIKGILARHYGFLGYKVVKELLRMDKRGEWEQLRDLYQVRVQALANRFTGNVADRLSRYVGLVWVTGDLVHSVLDLPGSPEGVAMSVMAEVAGELEEGDYATRSMEAVRAWGRSVMGLFHGKDDVMRPPNEYVGVWREYSENPDEQFVAFYPHRLKKFLVEQGFSYDAVIRQWRDRGWIRTQGGRPTYLVRIKDDVTRLIVVPMVVWKTKDVTND